MTGVLVLKNFYRFRCFSVKHRFYNRRAAGCLPVYIKREVLTAGQRVGLDLNNNILGIV